MAIPCVPTLGAVTFLTDIDQILGHVLRSYITLPKSRSDIYGDMIKSYMDDVSNISYDKTVFAQTVESSLMEIYDRIFENSSVVVSVSAVAVNTSEVDYNLEISITATDGTYDYTMLPVVSVSGGIIHLKNDTVYKEMSND